MNKKDYIRNVCSYLRAGNVTKPISFPKQVFHISDDEGNQKDFVVKKTDKRVIYTADDVTAIIDACIEVAKEALRKGDNVSIHGFGTLGLKYRLPRMTHSFGAEEETIVDGRYVPKFSFGNTLRMCAKVYELSLNDKLPKPTPLLYDDDVDEESDEDYGVGNYS